jgi:hypothetical protein
MIECARCGYRNDAAAKFCAACGAPMLPAQAPPGMQAPQPMPPQPAWGAPAMAQPPPNWGAPAAPPPMPQNWGPPPVQAAPQQWGAPQQPAPQAAYPAMQQGYAPAAPQGYPVAPPQAPGAAGGPGYANPYGAPPWGAPAPAPVAPAWGQAAPAAYAAAAPAAVVAAAMPPQAPPLSPTVPELGEPPVVPTAASAVIAPLEADQVPANAPKTLAAFLVTFDTNPLGEFWPIHQGQTLVGRKDSGADLGLEIDHPTTSSRHATIYGGARPGRLKVEDLGSTNGTYVNERRLEPGERRPLEPGDTLRFGGFSVAVHLV